MDPYTPLKCHEFDLLAITVNSMGIGIWRNASLKSMDVTYSPACREVLNASGVYI